MDPFFVPTISSSGKFSNYQTVTFQTNKCSIPSKNTKSLPKNDSSVECNRLSQAIDMKKARFEVYKFAQNSLHGEEKQKSKIELAIKLGAKPPKNKYKNYKLLKDEMKKEQEEAKKKRDVYNIDMKPRISAHKSKLNKGALRRKRKIGSGILNMYGKVTQKVKK